MDTTPLNAFTVAYPAPAFTGTPEEPVSGAQMKAFADPLMAAPVERFSVLDSRLHAVHTLVTEMGDSGRAEGVKVDNVNHQVGVLTGNMGSLKQELSDYLKKQEVELNQLTHAQQW